MWSYPNLVPLPEATVREIGAPVERLRFDASYGAWWGRIIETGAKKAVWRSVERYGRALRAARRTRLRPVP